MNAPLGPPYVEFGVRSNFSFLRAASAPEELVVAAKLLGHAGMGLADRNTVAGVVRAWSQSKYIKPDDAAEPMQLPFHPGCRLVFSDGTPEILAYPRDREGWGSLCRMLTEANLREETAKGATLLERDDLFNLGDRMSLAILPDLSQPAGETLASLRNMKDRFGANCWLAAAPLYAGDDRFRIQQAAALADASCMPLIATNDVAYHAAERRALQDVVTAIRLNTPVARAGLELTANAERHLKTPGEMARLFRHHSGAIAQTQRFAETLSFSLDQLQYFYPEEAGEGVPPQGELERLAWEGARWRYPTGVSGKVAGNIRHELGLIAQKQYAPYFLTVRDIMEFARSKGILCQGRGSAANSTVCYCLGITEVDPQLSDLLFERFISMERDEPPDIDVDFEHERREEVMQYIYEKYSSRRTALAAAVISYRGRSALREVSKAMGLSKDAQAALAGSIWGWSSAEMGETEAKAGGLDLADPAARHVIDRANEIRGFPRHLTQHVGGFVITQDRLDAIVPIGKTAMESRRMVEWDKDDLDAVGILKVDILALGMLSCLRRCLDMLEERYGLRDEYGRRLTLATLPREQKDVYDMICRADTIGVFQIESRAQMSMLPRLKPREFYDLVIEVAIVRPGPIQGDMVHPYLRRREGLEKAEYPRPELEAILGKTLGVPLFQEQAMRIAIEAGGFSPAKADKMRRAMATFKRVGTIGTLRDEMIEGMARNGYERDFAERCFKQIEGFGEYGFPESHAASFALLVYASAWFKAFYPDVFCAAILNAQPMGFYAPSQLVRDAREHGIEVKPVDINHSDWDCTLEEATFDPGRIATRHASMRGVICSRHAVRLGFRQVKGLPKEKMEAFVERRGRGYDSVRDVWLRSGLDRAQLEKLAEADAFGSIGLDRRAALWAVKALTNGSGAERLPLFERPDLALRDNEPVAALPVMPLGEHVVHDYRSLSLSLKAHPLSFLRGELERERTVPTSALGRLVSGRRVAVAGLVLIRQRPGSAKGVIFMTLEDEHGVANAIVWPKVFEKFRPIVLGARLVRVHGRLQSAAGVIHVVADRLEDLTQRLGTLYSEHEGISPLSRADEIRHPVNEDARTRPRGLRKPVAPPSPPRQPDADPGQEVARIMPRGRNFH